MKNVIFTGGGTKDKLNGANQLYGDKTALMAGGAAFRKGPDPFPAIPAWDGGTFTPQTILLPPPISPSLFPAVLLLAIAGMPDAETEPF